METVSSPLHLNIWTSHECASAASSDVDKLRTAAVSLSSSNQPKCFKRCSEAASLDEEESTCESPLNVGNMSRPKKKFLHHDARFQGFECGTLSPITEISVNLSDATLDTPNGRRKSDEGTPKGKILNFRQSFINGKHDLNTTPTAAFGTQSLQTEPHLSSKLVDKDFQMPRRHNPGSRRLNMDISLNEMAVDELSFYDDDSSSQQQRSFTASPPLAGLLSPEGSPQRFQIVEKQLKSQQPLARQQKQHPNALMNGITSTTSSNSATPAKSFRMFHSLSSGSMESSIDDEYMELFEMEALEQHSGPTSLNFPSDLNTLISGHIKSSSPANLQTPEIRRPSVRRCLSMTENQQQQQFLPKTPELLKEVQETANITPYSSRLMPSSNCCFKRPEPPSTSCSPIQPKRYRGDEKENLDSSYTACSAAATAICSSSNAASPQITRPTVLRKCMSMNDAEIMSALAKSDCSGGPVLIGDFSKPYALPLIEGRHRDLKSISSDTVARLINGEFQHSVAGYKIIDCRYPYEFEGGHIRGAMNLYTQTQIIEEFLNTATKTEATTDDNKRNIIIFHCEFSSERGPKLSRFLRTNDRARNTNAYPALDYPEVYLLHDGYKKFYETHSDLCDPHSYRPMLEPAYNEAYRHFRAKSKSWNGDGNGCATTRMKKSRSRLML